MEFEWSVKEDEMGKAGSTHGRETEYMQIFGRKKT
jgi:hypothetical protein